MIDWANILSRWNVIDAFSFIVGASCWEEGQLESEVAKGYWQPCSGNPKLAMGICDYHHGAPEGEGDDSIKPKSYLWLSMMCALNNEEGRLANLLFHKTTDGNGYACDDFR